MKSKGTSFHQPIVEVGFLVNSRRLKDIFLSRRKSAKMEDSRQCQRFSGVFHRLHHCPSSSLGNLNILKIVSAVWGTLNSENKKWGCN